MTSVMCEPPRQSLRAGSHRWNTGSSSPSVEKEIIPSIIAGLHTSWHD